MTGKGDPSSSVGAQCGSPKGTLSCFATKPHPLCHPLAVAPGMAVGTHTELSGETWGTTSGLGQCVGRQLMPRAGAERSVLPLHVLLLMCQHLPC